MSVSRCTGMLGLPNVCPMSACVSNIKNDADVFSCCLLVNYVSCSELLSLTTDTYDKKDTFRNF